MTRYARDGGGGRELCKERRDARRVLMLFLVKATEEESDREEKEKDSANNIETRDVTTRHERFLDSLENTSDDNGVGSCSGGGFGAASARAIAAVVIAASVLQCFFDPSFPLLLFFLFF